MRGRTIFFCLLLSLNAAGQEQDSISSGRPKRSASTFNGLIHNVQQYLDSATMRKVNPAYIEVHEKPWRVILRYKANALGVDYEDKLEGPGENEYAKWKMAFRPRVNQSVGLWVGYRGLGLGYSQSVTKNEGRFFSFGATGAKYGITFRLKKYKMFDTTISAQEYQDGKVIGEMKSDAQTYDPVWISSYYLNGYYVFNGKRYSQAAAYNQSVIQRHSAGSFLLGATFYQSSIDFSKPRNAGIMLLSHNIGRIKLQQASIGAGYGYNWVPVRGFVVNAMAMPSISVYSRVKAYKYDSNYDMSDINGQEDDYGKWNSETRQWENGKSHKPVDYADEEGQWLEEAEVWRNGSDTEYSAFRFSLDVRCGIVYNWRNYFIGLQGQFNMMGYKKDNNRVSILDGFGQASLGIRL